MEAASLVSISQIANQLKEVESGTFRIKKVLTSLEDKEAVEGYAHHGRKLSNICVIFTLKAFFYSSIIQLRQEHTCQ